MQQLSASGVRGSPYKGGILLDPSGGGWKGAECGAASCYITSCPQHGRLAGLQASAPVRSHPACFLSKPGAWDGAGYLVINDGSGNQRLSSAYGVAPSL